MVTFPFNVWLQTEVPAEVTLTKVEWDALLRAEYEKAWQEGYDVGFLDGERQGFEAGTELGTEPDGK